MDTSEEHDIETEGDKIKEGYVSEVDEAERGTPHRGRVRKAGYVVPDHVKDKEVPSSYEADTPRHRVKCTWSARREGRAGHLRQAPQV